MARLLLLDRIRINARAIKISPIWMARAKTESKIFIETIGTTFKFDSYDDDKDLWYVFFETSLWM